MTKLFRSVTFQALCAIAASLPIFGATGFVSIQDDRVFMKDVTTGNASTNRHGYLPKLPTAKTQELTPVGWLETKRANIYAFGAVGDGVTDDTAAFNAAKAASKRIWFPSGTFKGNFVIDSTCWIEGVDSVSVVLVPATNSLPVVIVAGVGDDGEYGKIENLTIDCDTAGQYGLQIGNASNGCRRFKVSNVRIRNFSTYGVEIKDATTCDFYMIDAQDGGASSIGFYAANNLNFQHCTFNLCVSRQNQIGFKFSSGNRLTFINCNAESNDATGYYFDSASTASGFRNSSLINCWAENNGHTPGGVTATTVAQVFLDGTASSQLTNSCNVAFYGGAFASDLASAYDVSADRAYGVNFYGASFSEVADGGFSSTKFRHSAGTGGAVFVNLIDCGEHYKRPTPTMYASFPALSSSGGESTSTLASYGIFYEFNHAGRSYSNRRNFGYAGSPVSNVTPTHEGEIVNDTSNNVLYMARGLTSADWIGIYGTETGTFTPTVYGSTTAGTCTYTVQKGFWHRVGKMVTISMRVTYSAHDGTGNMRIGGLPFTAVTDSGAAWPATVLTQDISYTGEIGGHIASGDNFVSMRTYGTGSAANLAMDASGVIDILCVYKSQ